MALRMILQEGDPTLKKQSREIIAFDERLHVLLDDMRETLVYEDALGLAAPQVGILRRAIVLTDVRREDEPVEDTLIELVNPMIVETEGEQEELEGCLSIPEVKGYVKRPNWVKVRAQDRHGEWFEIEGDDIIACALCHEIDHLDGKLFTEMCDELFDIDADVDESRSKRAQRLRREKKQRGRKVAARRRR